MARLERVVEHDGLVFKVGGLSRVAFLWKCSTGQLTQYVVTNWGVSEFTVSWLKFWICLCFIFFNNLITSKRLQKKISKRTETSSFHCIGGRFYKYNVGWDGRDQWWRNNGHKYTHKY